MFSCYNSFTSYNINSSQFLQNNESSSSSEDDSNTQVGYHKLKKIKKQKIFYYLQNINSSR